MVKLTGGGISGNKVVQNTKGRKVEPIARKANVAGVAQQGLATQFKKEPIEQGRGYEPQKMGATGIAGGNYNSASTGPGSLRTTYRSGSQGATPAPRDMPAGREILGSYGPEISGPSRRR